MIHSTEAPQGAWWMLTTLVFVHGHLRMLSRCTHLSIVFVLVCLRRADLAHAEIPIKRLAVGTQLLLTFLFCLARLHLVQGVAQQICVSRLKVPFISLSRVAVTGHFQCAVQLRKTMGGKFCTCQTCWPASLHDCRFQSHLNVSAQN